MLKLTRTESGYRHASGGRIERCTGILTMAHPLQQFTAAECGADHIRGRMYAVRPIGALGTCGWIDGRPWQVVYVTAANTSRAVALALKGKQ